MNRDIPLFLLTHVKKWKSVLHYRKHCDIIMERNGKERKLIHFMENIVIAVWVSILGIIAYIDTKELRIPNKLVLLLLLWYPMMLSNLSWKDSIIGGLMGGGVFLMAALLWRGKVGMGDVKLMGMVGLYIGKEAIVSCMIVSLFLAAMFGMTMVLKKKIDKTMGIPFAPFVFLATVFHYIKGIG